MFMQGCVLFNFTSQTSQSIPTKTYMQVFAEKAPEQYPKISKSFLTPRLYELCMRDFMNEHPTGLFDYYDARKDPKKEIYYFFFSYCFDGYVCYVYDIEKNKLVFRVCATTSPWLSDEELLSQTNDLNNSSTD